MTTKRRDMTERAFLKALERRGFDTSAIRGLGYVGLPAPYANWSISVRNGGSTYRQMLAYAIAEHKRIAAKHPVGESQ